MVCFDNVLMIVLLTKKKMKNILLLFTLFISVEFASLKNRYPKGTKKLVYKLKFNFI